MSLLLGEWFLVGASVVALPVAVFVTVALMYIYRFSAVQRIVFPGADECRKSEAFLNVMLDKSDLKPAELATLSQISHGILIRNGLNAIAVAIIFAVVFTGTHALLAVT